MRTYDEVLYTMTSYMFRLHMRLSSGRRQKGWKFNNDIHNDGGRQWASYP